MHICTGETISDAIEGYFDTTLGGRVWESRKLIDRRLRDTRDAIIESNADEIEVLRREYTEIRDAFSTRLASHSRQLESLWGTIERELQEAAPDLDDYPIPESNSAEEVDALYDGSRAICISSRPIKPFKANDHSRCQLLAALLEAPERDEPIRRDVRAWVWTFL